MIGAMLFSWFRFKSILHPHFIFTSILFVHYSDFFVRGYSDESIIYIDRESLLLYQFLSIMCFFAASIISGMITDHKKEKFDTGFLGSFVDTSHKLHFNLLIVAVFLFGIILLIRLYLSEWSIALVIEQMLGPRNLRSWVANLLARDIESSGIVASPIFQLISTFFPLSAVMLAFNIVFSKSFIRFMSVIVFLMVLFVLVTDGSRSPMMLAIASVLIFSLIKYRGAFARFFVISICGVSIVFLSSIMINFRSNGYADFIQGREEVAVTYHQDDSIYRSWSAYDYAANASYRWDPGYFGLTVIANPIPRMIWKEKPFLSQAFLGEYKVDYVTILFLGEFVAMFGIYFGTFFGIIYAMILYKILQSTAKLVKRPLGIIVYILWAIWIYSAFRSIQNLSLLVYAPLGATFGLLLMKQKMIHTGLPGREGWST